MSAVPATAYLMEFDRDGGPPLQSRNVRNGVADADDAAARIDAAHASGLESGKAAAMAALETRLEDERASFARQLASARQAWVAHEGEKLAQRLSMGLAGLEARVAETTARVLEPFLQAELRRQAIAELRAALEAVLSREPGIEVGVTGPEDLLQALRDGLSGRACAATYHPSDGPDVRIVAGQTILQTRLAAWVARIEEALR
jgi:hypothetical protein